MGLLDGFFGTPEQTQAIGLLGAGLMAGNPAAAFGNANQFLAEAPQRQLKQKLIDAQLRNYDSEIQARQLKAIQDQRQQRLMESFFPGLSSGGPTATPLPGAAPAGLPSAGAQPAPTAAPQTGGNSILEIAQRYGIPPQAIQADIVFNGGKKISELLDKHGSPDMQVTNGYAYDKNRLGPGYLPQLNVSQNGQTSMVRIGPDGLPAVSAPQGALETYSGYRNAEEAAKSGQDLVKIVGPDGAERYVTRAQAVSAAQPRGAMPQPMPQAMPQPQPGVTGNFVGDPAQVSAAIAGIADPQERANARAAFEEQARRTPGFGLNAPFQASPTTAQSVDKARMLKQAEADVQPTAQRKNDIAGSNYMLSVIDQAINHPGRETGTGLSATLDPRNYFPGTDATGFRAVIDQIRGGTFMQAYQNLKGGGQITEVEGKKAENAIARLNTAQSDDDYLSALKELRAVVQNGLTRQKAGAQTGGATGSFDGDNSGMVNKPNLVQSLPKTAAKGTRARDTATGKTLVFNGISWVPEK